METVNLSGPEQKPASGQPPKHLVILLHGYGADGNDLIGLAPMLAQSLPDTHFISPNAPFPCEMAPYGRQWFSLRDWSPKSMLRGAQEAAPALNMFISQQLQRFSLTDDKLALIGFSQGTMMALYTALRRPTPCAGIVGFSGSLIGEEGMVSKPPVCLIHGDMDNVVPFGAMALAEAVLKHDGISVETHKRPSLGHGIDPEGLDIAVKFLKANLK
ncbi:MAG TPA: alpha/beta fold hydrolase [Rickettsiales bacterium]|nr:alpha/beta fold hydrolase [Rickettsiales bacterium]